MTDIQQTTRRRARVTVAVLIAVLLGSLALTGAARADDKEGTPSAAGCAVASTIHDEQSATPIPENGPVGTATAGADCVVVDIHDVYFGSNFITIPSDTDVSFLIDNSGVSSHTFVIDDHENPDVKNLEVSVAVDPGNREAVTINAPAGTYYFYCAVPGHEEGGMWGMLKVEDNGKITAQHVADPKKAASSEA